MEKQAVHPNAKILENISPEKLNSGNLINSHTNELAVDLVHNEGVEIAGNTNDEGN